MGVGLGRGLGCDFLVLDNFLLFWEMGRDGVSGVQYVGMIVCTCVFYLFIGVVHASPSNQFYFGIPRDTRLPIAGLSRSTGWVNGCGSYSGSVQYTRRRSYLPCCVLGILELDHPVEAVMDHGLDGRGSYSKIVHPLRRRSYESYLLCLGTLGAV